MLGWEEPITHRQYEALSTWLSNEYNIPSRTDHYLMSVACEVRRVLSKNPNNIKPEHFILEFKQKEAESREPETVEQASAMAKAVWMARLGAAGVKPKIGSKNEDADRIGWLD